MIFNKTNLILEKHYNKLLSHGYTLEGDNKVLKNQNTGGFFNGINMSSNNSEYCDDNTKLRYLFKNELYKILLSIFYAYIQEELGMNKVKYTFKSLKTYMFSSFHCLPRSRVLLIIPDINKPCGVLDEPSIFYEGLGIGSANNFIQTGLSENYCIVMLNPNKNKYKDNHYNITYFDNITYAFEEFIEKKADFISDFVIFTSGLGGLAVLKLLINNTFKNSNLKQKTKKIIINNSKHGEMYKLLDKNNLDFWEKRVVNYIPASTPTGNLELSCKESGS
jgi:hypothetical protein